MKTDDFDEPEILNFILVPSLKSILIVNVAITLCKKFDIAERIRNHSIEFDPKGSSDSNILGDVDDIRRNEIESSIVHNSSLLPLPNILKAEIANVIRPILLQILEWMRVGRKDVEYMNAICWTNKGTIDEIQTLKQLIDNDTGQYTRSYFKLACLFCLEECIPHIWENLSSNAKENFLYYRKSMCRKYDNHFIAYWISTVNSQLSEIQGVITSYDPEGIYNLNDSIYKNMFSLAISEGNDVAAKYFWNKLSGVEIDESLSKWINISLHYTDKLEYQDMNRYSNILYFLLSETCDSKRRKILLENSSVILNSLFLSWPWQTFLLPTIKMISEFIDEKVYVQLLSRIVAEIKENKTTEKLLRQLWNNSTIKFKNSFIQYILQEENGTDIFCNLLIVEDMRFIKTILEYVTFEERKKMLFSLSEKNIEMFKVLCADKLSLFDTMAMSVLSEIEISHVKESIVNKHGNHLCHTWVCKNNWKALDRFLNWAFSTEDQIKNFKNSVLNKKRITCILAGEYKYELLNKFLCWCFDDNEKEINEFKVYFLQSVPAIIGFGSNDWSWFENFIDWCFDNEQAIKSFKYDFLHSERMPELMHDILLYDFHNFEFAEKLLCWFCDSDVDIKQYKSELVVSRECISLLQKIVTDYKVDSEWSRDELIKKFMKFFSPLDSDVIAVLKEKIANIIDFDDEVTVTEEELFSLLDNNSYNVDDCEYSSDENNDSDNIGDCGFSNNNDTSICCDADPLKAQVVQSGILNKEEID